MVQDLKFTKNKMNRWESYFVSSGTTYAVQLNVNADEYVYTSIDVIVYANIPGMDKVTLATLGRPQNNYNYMFEIDVPFGVVVTIESMSESISGKISTNGE